ncbi:MAG: hypothetical protein PHU85_18715 [Phycisphaerae bacterium]|nr:hypothetical protein [Phycisphaerae bacterium]
MIRLSYQKHGDNRRVPDPEQQTVDRAKIGVLSGWDCAACGYGWPLKRRPVDMVDRCPKCHSMAWWPSNRPVEPMFPHVPERDNGADDGDVS